MHYIITPSNEQNDIVFIGNSRTYLHIDPKWVSSVTGMQSYNLGLDGCTLPFFNMALCKYLQCHPKPKYVVINADFSGLNTNMEVYNYPDYQQYTGDSIISACLVPYYSEFKHGFLNRLAIFKQINSKPDEEKMANIIYHIKGIRKQEDKNGQDARRGYSPSNITWDSQAHKVTSYTAIYSSLSFDLMRQMIRTCREKNIKVIFLCTPLYKDYHKIVVNYDVIKDSLQNIASSNHVPYWIYSDTYISDTTANFYNVEHLNANGAAIFSKMLGEDIEKYVADSTYEPNIASRRYAINTP